MGNCECSRKEEEVGDKQVVALRFVTDGSLGTFTLQCWRQGTIGNMRRKVAAQYGLAPEFDRFLELECQGYLLEDGLIVSECAELQMNPVRRHDALPALTCDDYTTRMEPSPQPRR